MCCSFISGCFRRYCCSGLTKENVAIQETLDALKEEKKILAARIKTIKSAEKALKGLYWLTTEQQINSPVYQQLVIGEKTSRAHRAGSSALMPGDNSDSDSDGEDGKDGDRIIIKGFSRPSSPPETKQPELASPLSFRAKPPEPTNSPPPSKVEIAAEIITSLISQEAFVNGSHGEKKSDWNDEKKLEIFFLIKAQLNALGATEKDIVEIKLSLPVRINICYQECLAVGENLLKKMQ